MKSVRLVFLFVVFASASSTFAYDLGIRGTGFDSLYLIDSAGKTLQLKPGTLTSSFSLTLPTADGSSDQYLKTNGSGTLSWGTPGGMPVGTVITFAGSACPSGYLAADGSEVSDTTYSALCTVLGTTWGSSSAGNCKLPDLRNRFLRGVGSNADGNGGDSVSLGVYQGDAFQGHKHDITNSSVADHDVSGVMATGGAYVGAASIAVGNPTSDGTNGTPRTASETRPKAYGVLYCIKS